jgi:preprotein translocase subunit SecD
MTLLAELRGRSGPAGQPQDPGCGSWPKGGSEWDKVVGGQYFGKYIAIILDHRVESAPQINAHQFNGQATISRRGQGGFTHTEAENLALVMRYGALPVGFASPST